jgi:hypothetical protein
MRQTTATVLGFLVASSIPAAWVALVAPLSGALSLQSFVASFLVAYFFSAIATSFLGIPAFLALRRMGLVTWWSALASGLCIGAAMAIVIRLPNSPELRDLWAMGLQGGVSALAFWLIWRTGKQGSGLA